MLDELEATAQDAVMKVLVATFETGLVTEVKLSVVCELLGVRIPPEDDVTIDFDDKHWMETYIRFTHGLDPDAEVISINMDEDGDIGEQLRAHLTEQGVDADSIEEIAEGVLSTIAEHEAELEVDEKSLTEKGPSSSDKIH